MNLKFTLPKIIKYEKFSKQLLILKHYEEKIITRYAYLNREDEDLYRDLFED